MFKTTINYVDFDGVSREEDLYFNLTKMEMMDLELSVEGGFSNKLQELLNNNNSFEMFEIIKTFINKSYGVKSDDGRKFIKNDEVLNDFLQSAVYDEFVTSLITNEDNMNSFIIGIMPPIPNTLSGVDNNGDTIDNKAELIEKFKNRQNELSN